jgi:hypothetical protein
MRRFSLAFALVIAVAAIPGLAQPGSRFTTATGGRPGDAPAPAR